MATLQTYFIWFVFYSLVGWVWEVIICSVQARKFVNRGFLNGPYCPIYGAGGLMVIVLLGNIENPALIFLLGAVVTCTLEYLTSWAMEKLFHARWWDYSSNFLNINGRVCLLGAVAFGTLSVLLIKFIHPVVISYTLMLSDTAIAITSLALFALILTDLVYTLTRLSEFNEKLKELSERINASLTAMNGPHRTIRSLNGRINQPYEETYRRINAQERRLIKAFPKLRSTKYNSALEKIKQSIRGRGEDDELNEQSADTELEHRRGA